MFKRLTSPLGAIVKQRALLGATALALSLVATIPGNVSASAGSPSGTPAAVLWSYEAVKGGVSYTPSKSTNAASTFSVISATVNAFKNSVPQMRRANPNLHLLAYINGAYAQSNEGKKYPASWYLHTASGQQVRSRGYGNYLMDVAQPAWIRAVVQHCKEAQAASHYGGCFIDMMGTASVDPGYTNGLPINPRTGKVYSDSEWLALTSKLEQTVKSAFNGSVPIYANGLGSGPRYFNSAAPSKQLLQNVNGALAESWLRSAGRPLDWYPPEKTWQQNIDMVTDAKKTGHQVLLTVKTWHPGTDADRWRWQVFSFASYLLVANGSAAFDFMPTAASDATVVSSLETNLKLGDALGAYARSGNVYGRNFTNGKVLVNPGTSTQQVALGGAYKNQSGTVVTSVSMGPHSAQILTRL